jgi:hypothetical protein
LGEGRRGLRGSMRRRRHNNRMRLVNRGVPGVGVFLIAAAVGELRAR